MKYLLLAIILLAGCDQRPRRPLIRRLVPQPQVIANPVPIVLPPNYSIATDGQGNYRFRDHWGSLHGGEYPTPNEAAEGAWSFYRVVTDKRVWSPVSP